MGEATIQKNSITEGVIWKQLLRFFIPILLGTFFQQLYNTVDAVVVGQFLGKQALAAVGGGTGTVINLLIGFFTGLSAGATVVISQHFGARDDEKISKSIHTAFALSIAGAIAITAIGLLTSEMLLVAIGTPEDILPLAIRYIDIYFAGSVFVVVYNMGAGVFRAIGDSRSPFLFLMAGCVTNIVLDLLFVGGFGMGVEGAAYATVISQAVSVLLVVITLRRKKDATRLEFRLIRFDLPLLRNMLIIGIPAGIQSIMYTISNLIIQASINSFGTDTAAAWAAYSKLDQCYWMIVNAFGLAITTFVGQNFGAGRIDRARKGVKVCLAMASGTTIFLTAIYLLYGNYGLLLFTTDRAVIDIGVDIIMQIAPWFISFVPIELLSGAIRGAGKSFVPTVILIFGVCVLRIIWILIVPFIMPTLFGVLASYPITWVISALLFLIYYAKGDIYGERKRRITA